MNKNNECMNNAYENKKNVKMYECNPVDWSICISQILVSISNVVQSLNCMSLYNIYMFNIACLLYVYNSFKNEIKK